MKKLVLLFITSGILVACSNGNDTPYFEEVIEEEVATLKGNFVSVAHETTGTVLVNDMKSKLSLINFKTDRGPKLLVYLCTNVNANDFVSLGELKGTSGDFTYDIPTNTDLSKYKIVNIWCVDFSVSFGYAELK